MRFVMCGAGAIGGVLGGQLARAGHEVVCIDKIQAHVDAINTHGLQLKGVHGNHTVKIPAVIHASDITFRPDNAIVLAVKSFHCDRAAAELRRATTLELPVFCFQNGMANEAIAARYFHHVHGAMVLIGAKRLNPGEVIQTGNGPVGIGSYPKGVSQAARDVAAALEQTDLPVYTTEHIGKAKWNKMLINLNNLNPGTHRFGDPGRLRPPRDTPVDGRRVGRRCPRASSRRHCVPKGHQDRTDRGPHR